MSARSTGALIALGALLCLAPAWLRAQEEPERSASELMDVLMWNREPVGGPFTLVDHRIERADAPVLDLRRPSSSATDNLAPSLENP